MYEIFVQLLDKQIRIAYYRIRVLFLFVHYIHAHNNYEACIRVVYHFTTMVTMAVQQK